MFTLDLPTGDDMGCINSISVLRLKVLTVVFLMALSALGCGGSGNNSHQDQEPEEPPEERPYYGQVILGPVVDAQARLYRYNASGAVLWTGTTSRSGSLDSAGLIELPETLVEGLDDDALYCFEVTGGEDIDADDDGVVDSAATPNSGTIHMIAPGRIYKVPGNPGNPGFIISCLSDILYEMTFQGAAEQLSEAEIMNKLEALIPTLLGTDINEDGNIDIADTARWHPLKNKDDLIPSDDIITGVVERIHQGQASVVTVSVTASGNGAIQPDGANPVLYGTDVGVTFTPEEGYYVEELIVDGVSLGATDLESYQFNDIADSHTLEVVFGDGIVDILPFMSITTVRDVMVEGNYAYVVAEDYGFFILDVSDPMHPVTTGYLVTEYATDVDVQGGYAYIADLSGGLKVIDVRDPKHPTLLSTLPDSTSALNVFISGDYAYVSSLNRGLQIVDITNPEKPVITAEIQKEGATYDISVSGNYAYLTGSAKTIGDDHTKTGLEVIDISDPANPIVVGFVETDDPRRISLYENHAYIADISGLKIVDVNDPYHPAVVFDDDTGFVGGVTVSGGYLYSTSGTSPLGLLYINRFDIKNPASPKLMGRIKSNGGINSVYASGDYVYVSMERSGLDIVHFPRTEALNWRMEGHIDLPVTGDEPGSIFTDDNLLFLTDESGEVQIFDINDPSNPTFTSSYNTPGTASGIFASDGYAYIADGSAGLLILDIGDSAGPIRTGGCNTPGNAVDVFVSDNIAYVVDDSVGIQLIDISDRDNPVITGAIDTSRSTRAVCVSGNHAYAANGSGGLLVVDITDPENPFVSATLGIPGAAVDLSVSGHYVYITGLDTMDDENNLIVVDIEDPANPAIAGTVPFDDLIVKHIYISGTFAYIGHEYSVSAVDISDPIKPIKKSFHSIGLQGHEGDLAVVGDYAYVVSIANFFKVDVIDVSNPEDLTFLKQVTTELPLLNICVEDNYAYLAEYNYGLQIIDISNPGHPIAMGNVDTPGYAQDVVVNGPYAYVADWYNGLQVVDVASPDNPTLAGRAAVSGTVSNIFLQYPYAYLTGDGVGLQIIDISDPMAPLPIGGLETTPDSSGVYVLGNLAYLSLIDSRFQVIDIADPARPVVLGQVYTPGNANNIYVKDNFAYLETTNAGLAVIDISAPSHPVVMDTPCMCAANLLGTDDQTCITGGYNSNFLVLDTGVHMIGNFSYAFERPGYIKAVAGDYAYGTRYSRATATVRIIDIADLPPEPNMCHMEKNGAPLNAVVSGDTLFVAASDDGLRLFDISNPAASEWIADIDTPGTASDIFVSEGYAYVADRHAGLQIVDVSNPALPWIEGSINFEGWATDVSVADRYAYVDPHTGAGIHVIDVTEPENPVFTNLIQIAGVYSTRKVFISEQYAYVPSGYEIRVFDLHDSENPSLVSTFEAHGYANHIDYYLDGSYFYIIDDETDLRIVDVNNPRNPVEVGGLPFDIGHSPQGIFVSGEFAYVPLSPHGLLVIDVSNPANPVLHHEFENISAEKIMVHDGFAYLFNESKIQVLDLSVCGID